MNQKLATLFQHYISGVLFIAFSYYYYLFFANNQWLKGIIWRLNCDAKHITWNTVGQETVF